MVDKNKVLAGRNTVDAYRTAHNHLYDGSWHKGIPEEHTPLLKALVNALEGLGFSSTSAEFEPKKTEILAKFWDANEELHFSETGIADWLVRKNRDDLSLITDSPSVGIVAESQGARVEFVECRRKLEAELYKDDIQVDMTSPLIHIIIKRAVDECPMDARVFIGGLGLGLALHYLAYSGKSSEVIVCEVDSRVIQIIEDKAKNWFADKHPNFNFTVIEGDALEEYCKHGEFDWIYFLPVIAAPSPELEVKVNQNLTPSGIYTPYRSPWEGWWQ